MITMTRELAWAAARDAANRAMRKAGRTRWSYADYALAVAELERLSGTDARLEPDAADRAVAAAMNDRARN